MSVYVRLKVAERLGVLELAGETRVVGCQRSGEERRLPIGNRGSDAEVDRWNQAEPPVVPGAAEQHDHGFVQGIGGGDCGVHECRPDAATLVFRKHADRPEAQQRSPVWQQMCPRAAHVPDDPAVEERHQRQLVDPCRAIAEFVHQARLGRGSVLVRRSEGLGMDGADVIGVTGSLATNQHVRTLRRAWLRSPVVCFAAAKVRMATR